MRTTGVWCAGLLAAGLLSACDSGGGPAEVDDDAAWRTSTTPVETSGLSWAVGSTVHLPDGTTVDTGEPVRAYVLAGDGVFFVPADEDADGSFVDAPLWFVAPDGTPEDTGLEVTQDGGFATSPDGRFLSILDADTDDGSAVMRLFDLSTGELHDSEDGMDTSGIDDPVAHLLEMEVAILAVDDQQLTARVIQGEYAYDLATGEGREIDVDDVERPDPTVSPDGAWRIDASDPMREVLVSETGEEVVPETGTERWGLTSWVDDTTVVGVAIDGPGTGDQVGPDNSLVMITCTVPSGECTPVEGTEGERVLLPFSTRGLTGFDLATPEE